MRLALPKRDEGLVRAYRRARRQQRLLARKSFRCAFRQQTPMLTGALRRSRLAALDPPRDAVLRAAGVFGSTFSESSVTHLLGRRAPAPST
ncbi:MAG: hypothetical protein H6722_24395 [Sandaracinus sp.]|nr:hypothetical protein [Sandaracinus sp.]